MRHPLALVLGSAFASALALAQDPLYYTVAEIEAAIDARVAANPTRARKVNLSTLPGGVFTHEGRAIYALKISDNVALDEDEPAIVIAAQHHARELNSPVMVLGAADRILAGYGSDPTLTSLVNGYELYLVPTVNPDGVNQVWSGNPSWRKNRRNNGGGVFGVDNNRNYPFLWGLCGSSSTTSSETYRGPSAGSEPETQTMRNLIARLRPEIYLDFHSSGQEVLRTYAPCATVSTTMSNFIERYVDDLRAPMSYQKRDPSGAGEAPEDHWASGGTLSFLTEIGTSFQPPYSTTLVEEARVWPGIRRACTVWRPARRGHVRSSQGNAPLGATITYTPNVFNHGEVTRSRGRDGRYGLWLPLGSWSVTFAAPDHVSQTIPVTVTSYDSPVNLDVTLQAGCDRNIPDSNAAAGPLNVIPFGVTNSLQTLSTLFTGNNGGSIGGAIYFDVLGVNNSYIHAIDVNTGIGAGTPIEADVYYRLGTYAGSETNMASWTAWTAAKGVAVGVDQPSRLRLDRGLYIGGGFTYGIAIVARNFDHDYTNIASSYSDGNLAVSGGSASNVPFTAPVFNPRMPNVTLGYVVDASSFHNQIYQQVLRQNELAGAGDITELSFAPSTNGRAYNRILQIRMVHRPAGYALSTTFATNMAGTGLTTVLNQSYYSRQTIADQWNGIGLTTPFHYNGVDDVVVEIFARGCFNSDGQVGGYHRGDRERLWAHGWGFASQPATGAIDSLATKIRVEYACGEGGEFGTACGPLVAGHTGSGAPGTTFRYTLDNALPGAGAILQLGFTQTNTSLTASGFTNCWTWNDNVASTFKLTSANGTANHPIALPNSSVFDGLRIYGHWYGFDASAPGGLTVSNYTRLLIGTLP
ncbi:MAG: hypothetical protein KDE27_31610 [Planctomycetes bacterium]|nr:hypothetical protein [Planctomycetota bacterium]